MKVISHIRIMWSKHKASIYKASQEQTKSLNTSSVLPVFLTPTTSKVVRGSTNGNASSLLTSPNTDFTGKMYMMKQDGTLHGGAPFDH